MSEDSQNSVIANAGAIIQRFGGLRPMSKATGIPVTTIQGWKKRDIIPATRREEIRRYARDNNITIDDLLDSDSAADAQSQAAGTENARQSESRSQSGSQSHAQAQGGGDDTLELGKAREVKSASAGNGGRGDTRQKRAGGAASRVPKGGAAQSAFMGQMAMVVVVVLVAVIAAGALMFWPDLRQVPEQNERIAKLENNVSEVDREVEQVKDRQGYLDAMVPDDLKNQLSDLHGKTRELSQTTSRLSEKMTGMSGADVKSMAKSAVSEENIQNLENRVGQLEQQMRQYAEDSGLGGISAFMTRLKAMQNAEAGRKQLSQAASQLHDLLGKTGGDMEQLKKAMMSQKGKDDALGKTLEGVEQDNLKAAAMLMAFSNLRGALSRDRGSFKQDLSLMKRLVDEDNKELNTAINRLAPEARDGVLTPSGLSREFRSFAGEIVAASLQGEDVSITDKAKARMSEILTVKKDGRDVTGTKEQKLVAEAKQKLDQGDVDGAVAALRQLDGKAADKARPFIEKAQATSLANQVKQMLSRQVMQQLGDGGAVSTPATGAVSSGVPRYNPGNDMQFRPEQVQPRQGQ